MLQRVLVTGGGGFLGQAIIRQLRAQQIEVRSFSRSHYPQLDELSVEQFQGDLGSDEDTLLKACEGVDAIFHVAAKVGVWGTYEDFFRVNVEGTRQIIKACQTHQIDALIYTSSPSIVFDGKDMEGVDESVPYPETYDAHYPATKAIAEREVLEANSETLKTVALRPHLIWGPGDPHLVTRIIQRTRAGRLRRIGDRDPLVDTVFVENAAQAHLLAAQDLIGPGKSAGKAYFITNDEPIGAWTMIDRMLEAGGLPPLKKKISKRAAQRIAGLMEGAYKLVGAKQEPPLTKFVVKELSTAHWFDISAAREDLGYNPQISLEEGLKQLKQWLSTQDL